MFISPRNIERNRSMTRSRRLALCKGECGALAREEVYSLSTRENCIEQLRNMYDYRGEKTEVEIKGTAGNA